jgi:transcriptional regulator with XRE-family HTH domain
MAELADKAKLSPSSVNQIEKGRHSPSAETIEAFAKALDIDPCWLAYGTGTKPDWLSKDTT